MRTFLIQNRKIGTPPMTENSFDSTTPEEERQEPLRRTLALALFSLGLKIVKAKDMQVGTQPLKLMLWFQLLGPAPAFSSPNQMVLLWVHLPERQEHTGHSPFYTILITHINPQLSFISSCFLFVCLSFSWLI